MWSYGEKTAWSINTLMVIQVSGCGDNRTTNDRKDSQNKM